MYDVVSVSVFVFLPKTLPTLTTAATGAICHAQRWVSTGTQAAVKPAVVTVATLAVLGEVVRVGVREERISNGNYCQSKYKIIAVMKFSSQYP